MRVVRALRSPHTPDHVLLLLQARARRRGLPPPAALIGDWYSSRAVLVPSVHLAPAAGFAVPTKVSEHDASAGAGSATSAMG